MVWAEDYVPLREFEALVDGAGHMSGIHISRVWNDAADGVELGLAGGRSVGENVGSQLPGVTWIEASGNCRFTNLDRHGAHLLDKSYALSAGGFSRIG
jgi:hypothetical protein